MSAPHLAAFARRHLAEGRGEWWIVDEMSRRWNIDEPDARAVVANVSPGVYRSFLLRRRILFAAGVLVMGLSVPTLVLMPLSWDVLALSAVCLIAGTFLAAVGRPGLARVRRGDAPTSLPGRMTPHGPGLGFRLNPFEWK